MKENKPIKETRLYKRYQRLYLECMKKGDFASGERYQELIKSLVENPSKFVKI